MTDSSASPSRLPIRSGLTGLFAAVTTPRTDRGSLDLATFDRHVEWLLEAGVDGICLGGATSEYPAADADERRQLIRRAARRLRGDKALLVAVGAPMLSQVLTLAACAFDVGSRAVLLPMPMFFRYQQQDLQAYAASVSRDVKGPCLLYDLPVFTNPLEPATVVDLLRGEANVVGIKDSSGQAPRIAYYAKARGGADWALLVGDDSRLREGLEAGWEGGISGVAAACPELMVAIVRAFREGRAESPEAGRAQVLLSEFIAQISSLPVPWGIRLTLEVRGISTGPLPWPLSPARREQAARFQAWVAEWFTRYGEAGLSVRSSQTSAT
jgi:dihydrodipicolinate synthase/N-acetylneuraminate lyase